LSSVERTQKTCFVVIFQPPHPRRLYECQLTLIKGLRVNISESHIPTTFFFPRNQHYIRVNHPLYLKVNTTQHRDHPPVKNTETPIQSGERYKTITGSFHKHSETQRTRTLEHLRNNPHRTLPKSQTISRLQRTQRRKTERKRTRLQRPLPPDGKTRTNNRHGTRKTQPFKSGRTKNQNRNPPRSSTNHKQRPLDKKP